MLQPHLAAFPRRLQHGLTSFEGGAAPFAGMKRWRAVQDGGGHLVEHFGARHSRRIEFMLDDPDIGIDPDPVGQGTDICSGTTHHQQAKMFVGEVRRSAEQDIE